MADSVPKDRDEDSGQYTEVVSDDEFLDFLRKQGGAGTSDVADAFGYERPTAYRRLKRLEEDGKVTSQEIGNSLLWELANDE